MGTQAILVSIDGMRPDGLMAAETPTIDRLMANGRFTLTARTVMPSITFPCHNSMLRSVPPTRHGITTNVWVPLARPVPSLIEMLADQGKACGMFFNWQVLRDLAAPEKLKASFFVADEYGSNGTKDMEVAQLARTWLTNHLWDFAFVYFGYTDLAGHDHGWMSSEYLAAISHADRCLGHLLEGMSDDCWVMVVSDHGGHGQSHGTEQDEDMTIPIVLAPNQAAFPPHLSWQGGSNAEIIDVAPTLLNLFGLQPPYEWMGQSLIA